MRVTRREMLAGSAAAALGSTILPELAAAKDKAKSKPKAPRTVTNSVGMTLVSVPPGEFIMGSARNEKGRHDDETAHTVRITRGFYIAATEVTQTQWQTVMGFNPCKTRGDKLPVHGVSWPQAVEFCKKLSAKERKGYRLPTEAQWEYACRAGTKGAFGGGDPDKMAWHMDNSGERVRRVATRMPNAWGIYDMHGNAMEWTADWYGGPHDKKAATDPKGPKQGKGRVGRGGSWLHFGRACRSAARVGIRPTWAPEHMGFRVAMAPGKTETQKT
ncbi:MAG: formylglycine-generating enzyme family protein [Phycisphaerae bacterium]|nr:formylglycine-generating enzyme family protein [Phycisphaerae bacterium]